MRISYSALETFQNCPAKYKFQYIDRIKAPKSKEAVFGTLIHEALKVFHEPNKTTPLSEDELLKYFTEKWDPNIYQDTQEEAFAFHQGVELLKNYYRENSSLQYNIVNLETSFLAPILEELNPQNSPDKKQEFHQITGRIDRIDKLEDGGFEVIDYKTSKKMPEQKYVDDNFQLSIYYLGLINRWPGLKNRPIKLSLYFLKHGEKLSAFRTDQQLNETKEKIISLVNDIKKSNFEPKPSALCNWCPYQPHCPMFKHKFINKQTLDNERVSNIIKEYFEIKNRQGQDIKRTAELKKLINQYCDEQKIERIFGEEGYITRLLQQRFEYDFTKIKEVLEPINKWNEVLTIDKIKLKKVASQLPYHLQKMVNKSKKLVKEFKIILANKIR